MESAVLQKLQAINQEFYQTFASQFAATRLRLQPGVLRVLKEIPVDANILDLGCGNGELARRLLQEDHRGQYLGLDFSITLLDLARRGVAGHEHFSFLQVDLTKPRQIATLQMDSFDRVVSFAALHHLPGAQNRVQLLENVRNLLRTGGRFIHSNWQFLNSPKLRARIQPWEEIDLTAAEVDSGDYLLDWRQGGRGLRYVHHFGEEELAALADVTGFEIVDSFYSDGEGGNLGLYQIWKPKPET